MKSQEDPKRAVLPVTLILPAALSVYFIAIYVGAAMGADWALNNDTYVHMNSWFHYAKLYAVSSRMYRIYDTEIPPGKAWKISWI